MMYNAFTLHIKSTISQMNKQDCLTQKIYGN